MGGNCFPPSRVGGVLEFDAEPRKCLHTLFGDWLDKRKPEMEKRMSYAYKIISETLMLYKLVYRIAV